MTDIEELPGRTVPDEERTPLGLGWEYARRGWKRSPCPLADQGQRREFYRGWDEFVCSNPETNAAMLRGIDGNP